MNAPTTREAGAVLELEPIASNQLPAEASLPAEGGAAGFMLAILQRGGTPADVREMIALQRELRADEARNAFNHAMAGFKAEPVYVSKSKGVGYTTAKGEFVGYKHAELSDVVAAVGPALAKHGLSHRWDVKQSADWISVTCILKHALGHSEVCEMGAPPDDSGKKNRIQQIASTVSYLQRYTLKAITGVAEGGEDDDGQGAGDAQVDEKLAGLLTELHKTRTDKDALDFWLRRRSEVGDVKGEAYARFKEETVKHRKGLEGGAQ